MSDKDEITPSNVSAQGASLQDNKRNRSGGAKLFWFLLLGGLGVFLYTANEGQDNMFEDAVVLFDKAKDKVSSFGKSSPKQIAGQILQNQLKSPESFRLQRDTLIWSGQTQSGEPAYIVLIDSSATNGFGGAVRACHLVSFRQTADGQAQWSRKFGIQKLEISTCQVNLSSAHKNELSQIFVKANGFKAN